MKYSIMECFSFQANFHKTKPQSGRKEHTMFEEHKKFEEWTPEVQRETYIEYMENHDVEDTAEVRQSTARALEYFGRITGMDKADIEDMLSYLGYEYEKQGFINGFQFAMQVCEVAQEVGVAL